MELRRFYVNAEDITGDAVVVTGTEYRHMTQVLRFKVGYLAIICDNTGMDYMCEVVGIDKQCVSLRITDKLVNQSELGYPLTLCMGLIKPEKMTIAVQKAVELGVTRICPFRSTHTSETNCNIDRLQTIVREACKQCGRAIMPEIAPLVDFAALDWGENDCYIAYEHERGQMLRDAIIRPNKGICVIIGSEGGLTREEVERAVSLGAKPVSLGKRILRAETAAIVALGAICQLTEEL